MEYTADYGLVQYRTMISQHFEIIAYYWGGLNISLWHTDSSGLMIHDWPLLQQNIQSNDKLPQQIL